jgi:Brp/Blh family beta-carotene 15,15'-monooxygenase
MKSKLNLKLTVLVIIITLIITLLGWLFPDLLAELQYPIMIFLVVTIGLPHGATDFLLFRRLQRNKLSKEKIFMFFTFYVLMILGFLALWLVFPVLSFLFFLFISSYHFGQSNWEKIEIPTKYSFIINLFWGAFAVGGPVLWHWDQSQPVISQVIGFVPDVSAGSLQNIQLTLVLINIVLILFLNYKRVINFIQFRSEIAKVLVLSVLFYSTPMLLGFAVYFGLWHSLHSLLSQLSFYQKVWPKFSIFDYYRKAAPYTILAVFGFLVMMVSHPFILPGVSMISTFLIFISCVTLPHIILIEESYRTFV